MAATYQGRSARFFRCAYQAKVMKTFEAMSSRVAPITGLMPRFPSTAHSESAQSAHGALVALVHDAVPAAAARGGDVVGPVVYEHRVRGLECEAALGLGINARVRLHDAGQIGGQGAMPDPVHAVLARQVCPMQIADVRQQIDAMRFAHPMGEIDHPGLELEHLDPELVHPLE